MSKLSVELIIGDEWHTLKINDEVIFENHSIGGDEVLEILGNCLHEHMYSKVIYES